MPKFTIIGGPTARQHLDDQPTLARPDAIEALSLLKDFLRIDDPAVQRALAELVAALAKVTG